MSVQDGRQPLGEFSLPSQQGKQFIGKDEVEVPFRQIAKYFQAH